MMEKFAVFQHIPLKSISLVLIFLQCLTATGPSFETYKNVGELKDIFPKISDKKDTISIFFPVYFYPNKNPFTGELVFLEKTYVDTFQNQRVRASHLLFQLRIISENVHGHLRLKTYQGTVFIHPSKQWLDLQSDECYVLGKRNFKDRWYVIDGWECDHLIFQLSLHEDQIQWKMPQEHQDSRTQWTKWFLASTLRVLPEFYTSEWYGKWIYEKEEDWIFFGYEANRHLKKDEGVILLPYQVFLKVENVLEDFVFTKKPLNLTIKEPTFIIKTSTRRTIP
ncbi:MAG: hypothetical protein NZ853_07155 [Leptospiraceae bacterium]|nr:hypothetical protein [Leptospiraceae bacterium]MDW7975789.1 hypothetical protein [Leptospiraceae bacterium]